MNLEWLFSIAINGRIPPHSDFEVMNGESEGVMSKSSTGRFISDIECNGNAFEPEEREGKIIDITNGKFSHLKAVLPDIPDSVGNSQKNPPLKPPDPSRHLPFEETISMTDCPTVYQALVPSSTISISPLSPVRAENDMALTFGEPIGLRIPGYPRVIENDSASGCSPKFSHPLPREELSTERDIDNRQMQIPFSCSPSPLKIVPDSVQVLSPPISETRGLRTAITALLGKRGPEPKADESTTQKRPIKRLRSHFRQTVYQLHLPRPQILFIIFLE